MKSTVLAGLTLILAGCATAPIPRLAPNPRPPEDQRTLMVDGAKAMLGQPYHFGGAAPGGFDCSGLVVYAAAGAGIALPRTAHEQIRAGVPIMRRDVQAGDLVFMHVKRKELHVGIAIDGQRFVHAPATGRRVRIDLLDSPPYAQAFLTARRVIGSAARSGTAAAIQSPAG